MPKGFKTYPLLQPLGWLYGLIMEMRNKRFDSGKKPVKSFDVPVISVGNLSVGGTGKTPMSILLLRMLKEGGLSPALLSRGYGRKTMGFRKVTPDSTAKEVGDEPLEVFHTFNNSIPVFVCEDRCEGARRLLQADGSVDCIVLDDAYQHRYIDRDINIMLTDYGRLYSRDKVLPAGRLRERRKGAQRADIVVVTKCPANLSQEEANAIRSELKLNAGQSLFYASIAYDNLIKADTKEVADEAFTQGKRVLIFTGIAKASPLINHYKEKCSNLQTIRFADHHAFSAADISNICQASSQSDIVVTTDKDYNRLPQDFPPEVKQKLYIQKIRVNFLFNQADEFNQFIANKISNKTKR